MGVDTNYTDLESQITSLYCYETLPSCLCLSVVAVNWSTIHCVVYSFLQFGDSPLHLWLVCSVFMFGRRPLSHLLTCLI